MQPKHCDKLLRNASAFARYTIPSNREQQPRGAPNAPFYAAPSNDHSPHFAKVATS